ncbi:MAG: glycosyltransferase, partial [candidate division WOR-3 bacterium]
KESIKMPSIFEPVELKVEEKRGVCWVGNLREEKRPEIFVQLAKLLPDEVFYMVGRISERYKGSFGNPKNLKILGELEYTEAIKVMAKSKVYVNTSVNEGFPNTFLESWYYKTLIIAFDADPDGVIAKGLGIKVKTLDEATSVIKDFNKNPQRYEKIIQRAYNYVLENHLPQKVIGVFKERVMGRNCR